ncbi:MAG: iron ABC transporter permease [Dysgonamonadaceae bacterium]|jgi:iron complex transport system permease protein|nr:iron ABC transporter permease [Dysgonamonadaceae bacterium]
MSRRRIVFVGFAIALTSLFLCNLFYGTVSIPARAVMDILLGREIERTVWASIVTQSRLPQATTALLAGSALAVSGLMLQTLFRNPLAGPSILGISSGANLGVAVVMLYSGGMLWQGFSGHISVILAAFTGAFAILLLILYFSIRIRSSEIVLILGIIIGYLASAGISILNSMAASDNIRAYVLWGMGSFADVHNTELPFFSASILAGLFFSLLLIKPLNSLLLGDNYAANLGVNIINIRIYILVVTGYLTAIVTAYCGPITFIGLVVPHIARMLLGTSNRKTLLPSTILAGAIVALFCNMMTVIPFGKSLLPLNAITPFIGAPVIIYVIMGRKRLGN